MHEVQPHLNPSSNLSLLSNQESLPREYAQIFAFDNFRRTQKAVLKKQEQADRESLVVPGMYVRLHLLITPAQRAQAEQLVSRAENGTSGLVTVMGLLQHETKMSVVHYRWVHRVSRYWMLSL